MIVIFADGETNYSSIVEASPEQGVLQIDLDLEEQLNKPENQNCLFAVKFLLCSSADDPVCKDERYLNAVEKYRILCDCGLNLNSVYSELNGYLNGNVEFDYFINALKWWKACISFDEIELFTKQLFGEDAMEVLRALYNADEDLLYERNFLEKCLPVLECIITYNKHYDISEWEQNAFIDGAILDYAKSLDWLYEKRIDYFRQVGIEIQPVDPVIAALNNLGCTELFSAVLTKEQIYSLKNSKYGVSVFFQGKGYYQMD